MTLPIDVAHEPVFTTGTRAWTWSDVFLEARITGAWDAVLAATRDAGASADAVKQAGREWRRARRLIAGDELKAWLARRRLTMADWNAYLRRVVGESTADAPPDPEALWAEGACSGAWDALAERLSARVAAWEAAGTPGATQPPPADWFARMPSAGEALEIGVAPADVAARCGDLWAAAVSFARLRAAATASDAVAATVASHNVDWLRVECDWLEATDEDVAREAALLARADGVGLHDVARRAGLELEPRQVYVGDVDPELQPTLISAAPGDLVGPVALGGGGERWLVVAVRDKVVPTVEDPDVRARAEQAAVEVAVRRAIDEQVTWHEHD